MNLPPIQFRRSTVSGEIPDSDSMSTGEISLNFADQLIYTRDSDGKIFTLGGGAGSVDPAEVDTDFGTF